MSAAGGPEAAAGPLLLTELPSNMHGWRLSAPYGNGPCKVSYLSKAGGGPVSFMVCPKGTLDAVVPFEPSVFRGTGDEPRKVTHLRRTARRP